MNRPTPAPVPRSVLGEIAEISSDAIVCVDSEQRIVFFNHGAERIFGWTSDEVIGGDLAVLLPPSVRAAHAAHVAAFARAPERARLMGQRSAISGLRKNGEEFPAEASIAKAEHDGGLVLAVALRDTSERARAERDQQFLARTGVVLGSSLEVDETCGNAARLAVSGIAAWSAIYLLDPDTTVLRLVAREHAQSGKGGLLAGLARHVTASVADGLGLGAGGTARLLDAVPRALVADAGSGLGAAAPRSVIVAPLLARDAVAGALVVGAAEGASFDGEAVFAAQELASRAAMAIDNARLYQSARRAVLGRDEIMSIVSHDVGTAISAILVTGKALEKRLGEGAGADLVANIRNAARQVGRLVSDLLDAERLGRGSLSVRPEPTEVSDVVRRAREMVDPSAAERGVEITVETDAAPDRIHADADRVVQILCNVLGNAVKYSPDGGRVRLRIAGGSPIAGHALFSVSDEGPGIREEDLPRLFEPFWRGPEERAGGAGLGLAIARGLVRAHGGEIEVDSPPGAGATVRFTLPAAE